LLVHPPMDGLPRVWNWIVKTVKTPAIIEVDDDFVGVRSLVGSKRFITDPEQILQILENSLQCISDLGITTFTFNRSQNIAMTHPEVKPIRPVGPIAGAFGVLGAARERLWDEQVGARAGVDFTLQCLLDDRVMFNDMRYYFDFGEVYGGRGGNVGIFGIEEWTANCNRLKEKWGRHISFDAPGWVKNRQVAAMSVRVARRNKRGQR